VRLTFCLVWYGLVDGVARHNMDQRHGMVWEMVMGMTLHRAEEDGGEWCGLLAWLAWREELCP
jgi:hypothetical protein